MKENVLEIESIAKHAAPLNGTPVADAIKREVALEVNSLVLKQNVRPRLAVIRVGDDPASASYVAGKLRASEALGIGSEEFALESTTSTEDLLELVRQLNRRFEVDGILVQLPLPTGIQEAAVLDEIDPNKDVDGFHPVNIGRLVLGQETLAPCTPAGIIELLVRNAILIAGVEACVVGRSHIVGRPVAQMLVQRDATVTICHSRTRNLAEVTRRADILIAAIGRPAFIRGEHIKPGATVVDVGINRVADAEAARGLFKGDELEKRLRAISTRGATLVGDVHPAEADLVAGRRTPVPGGVGPLTVAMLMHNTVTAARRRRGL